MCAVSFVWRDIYSPSHTVPRASCTELDGGWVTEGHIEKLLCFPAFKLREAVRVMSCRRTGGDFRLVRRTMDEPRVRRTSGLTTSGPSSAPEEAQKSCALRPFFQLAWRLRGREVCVFVNMVHTRSRLSPLMSGHTPGYCPSYPFASVCGHSPFYPFCHSIIHRAQRKDPHGSCGRWSYLSGNPGWW